MIYRANPQFKTRAMASSLYAVPYDGTAADGGDSLTVNLNQYYEVCELPMSSAITTRR